MFTLQTVASWVKIVFKNRIVGSLVSVFPGFLAEPGIAHVKAQSARNYAGMVILLTNRNHSVLQ